MEPFIGQIQLFPYYKAWAPRRWVKCEGQLLPIESNQTLYSLLGTTYGGDDRTNFGLPDLRGKEPVKGTYYCIAIEGVFPSRN